MNPWEIHCNYLDPVKYPHNFCTYYYFNIYQYVNNAPLVQSGITFVTTIKSSVVSGSITKDRSSDYISSADLELVVENDCPFDLNKAYNWENKIIQVIKGYEFPDSLINNRNLGFASVVNYNGKIAAEISLGYYKVDTTAYQYDASTRSLSLSCTDVLSVLGSEHGGNLVDFQNIAQEITGYIIKADVDCASAMYTIYHRFSPLLFSGTYINLYNYLTSTGDKTVPYDLEFGTETSALNMMKEVKNLYGDKIVYVGNDFRLFADYVRSTGFDFVRFVNVFAKDFSPLVISENVNVDKNNIKNYYTVYGKTDEETNIQYKGEYFINDRDNPLNIYDIGIRKTVIENDKLPTNDYCYNEAKWQCYKDTMFRETTSIVIVDNFIPIFTEQMAICSVGDIIEYTSIITGETNTYIVNKVSHDLSGGTWNIDMQRFRPLFEDTSYYVINYPNNYPEEDKIPYDIEWGKWDMKPPVISVTYENDGKAKFVVHCHDYSKYALYKFWLGDEFIGETITDVGDIANSKVFYYTFQNNGNYRLSVQAYNPQFPPSDKSHVYVNITNISDNILTNEIDTVITNEADIILTK